MNNADEEIDFAMALYRLKGQLRLDKDKDVAKRLGLTNTGLAERKRRNSFPIEKLHILAANNSHIDVNWVLTGKGPTPMNYSPPPVEINSRDHALLSEFNRLSEYEKHAVEVMIKALLAKTN